MAETQEDIVRLNELDTGFAEATAKAEAEKINLSIQCGTCSTSCWVGTEIALRTGRIIRKVKPGSQEIVPSDNVFFVRHALTSCDLVRCTEA